VWLRTNVKIRGGEALEQGQRIRGRDALAVARLGRLGEHGGSQGVLRERRRAARAQTEERDGQLQLSHAVRASGEERCGIRAGNGVEALSLFGEADLGKRLARTRREQQAGVGAVRIVAAVAGGVRERAAAGVSTRLRCSGFAPCSCARIGDGARALAGVACDHAGVPV